LIVLILLSRTAIILVTEFSHINIRARAAAPEAVDDPHEEPEEIQHIEEIPEVEAAPDPHEDQLSLGELYLKYYAEALARHTAEAD